MMQAEYKGSKYLSPIFDTKIWTTKGSKLFNKIRLKAKKTCF